MMITTMIFAEGKYHDNGHCTVTHTDFTGIDKVVIEVLVDNITVFVSNQAVLGNQVQVEAEAEFIVQ